MSSFSSLVPNQYRIGLGELIYVLVGDSSTGGNSPEELGDFVATNTALSKTTYNTLYNSLSFNSNTEAVTWTARTSGTTSNLLRVHYYNNQYVYCGFSGAFATSTNSSTWTIRNTGLTGILSEVVYGNGVYVVVAESPSGVASSNDAITWTVRNGQTSTNLYSLAYGNGLFVYGGTVGALGTSTDGTTWSSVTSGTTSQIGVHYGGGVFGRIVGSNFSTSTDGVTWTLRNSGSITGGIVYGNGLWAYLGTGGALGFSSDGGVTWTARNSGTTAILRYLKYANGVWILTGNGGTLRTSTDTITWTARTAVNSLDTVGVTYSDTDGLYLYAAYGGTIAYSLSQLPTTTQFKVHINQNLKPTNIGSFNLSANGKYYVKYKNTSYSDLPIGTVLGDSVLSNRWTLDILGPSYVRSSGIYEQNVYPELNTRLGKIAASVWSNRRPQTTGTVNALTYGNGTYVYGGTNGLYGTSIDGLIWTARALDSTIYINAMIYANGIYVYVGDRGDDSIIRTSTDAVTLTARTTITTLSIYALTYGNSTYVYGGFSGTLATSTDAITWTARTSGTATAIRALAYGNNTFVYGANGGVLRTSTDAITWTARTSGTTSTILALVYADGIFVYGGNGGVLATSTDAITWTARTSGTTSTIRALTYGNNIFVYSTNGGGLATSTDAITWTTITSETTSSILALTYGNGVYVYGGNGGMLGTSTNTITPAYSFFYNAASHFIVPDVKHDSLASQFVYVKAKS